MEHSEKKNGEKKIEELIETDIDFGFENDGTSKYSQVYFVKPKLKDGAYFELTWNKDGKKYISKTQKLQGKLLKIEQSSYVYDKKIKQTLKFHIEWMNKEKEPVLFILGSTYTSVLRNLLNSLLSCKEPIEKLSLTLYENKNGYGSLYTLINSKKSEWKYSWKFLSDKIELIKHPKTLEVIQRDYDELDEFLKDELLGMINIIIPNHKVIIPEQPAETHFKDKSDNITENDDKDFFGPDDDDFEINTD